MRVYARVGPGGRVSGGVALNVLQMWVESVDPGYRRCGPLRFAEEQFEAGGGQATLTAVRAPVLVVMAETTQSRFWVTAARRAVEPIPTADCHLTS